MIDVGSDGSDGVFAPGSNITIDLNQAVVGNWNDPSLMPGKGIYDPNVWAVVFKYESVNIPAGVTVQFTNRTIGNPPVVWLVRTNATVAGTVSLNGQNGQSSNFAIGGPGGFAGAFSGGNGQDASSGFGPGGGTATAAVFQGLSGGSYGMRGIPWTANSSSQPLPPYGNATLMPLIGGSGGSSWMGGCCYNGGAGGGALLLAVGNTLSGSGLITANGGTANGGGGSDGGVRIIANRIAGPTRLRANGGVGGSSGGGGTGGSGRIRIEANDISTATFDIQPFAITGPIGPIFPPANTPKVVIASVEGAAAPSDPRSDLAIGDIATSPIGATVEVDVNAFHVPSTWIVQVQIRRKFGPDMYVNAARISGNDAASIYRASVAGFPLGISAIQVRAYAP